MKRNFSFVETVSFSSYIFSEIRVMEFDIEKYWYLLRCQT